MSAPDAQPGVWGGAEHEHLSATITDMHEALVARLGPRADERWLDVGTGTGACARLAAAAGTKVVGLDQSPALIATARRLTDAKRLQVEYQVGDAELLPFADGSFDVVCSAVGVMWARDKHAAARELARVCLSGGRLGLTTWRPDDEEDRVLAPFLPATDREAGMVPYDWGREEDVHALLGGDFDLEISVGNTPLRAKSGQAVWDLLIRSLGPFKALASSLPDAQHEKLREAYVDHVEHFRENNGVSLPRDYLLIYGTRR